MYGTGIVMCDAHDKRDFRFARKYKIPLKFVISNDGKPINPKDFNDAFINDGILFNSGKFSGMNNKEALPKIADWLEKNKLGKKITNYKIRDWMISRQRYWGTPIPVIYCDKCGIIPVPENQLPVLLPEKVDFKSNNPLASNKEWINVKCPKCGKIGKRETDTMGGFVDSSWYFLRYCDNKNDKEAFSKEKVKYWMPVDQYIGGAEHAVMHLIYARFFIKVLKDLKIIDFDEPFSKLFNQGILYKDGAKMSKSKGNIVTQDEIAKKYGIDTARLFLMFVSSPEKQMEWSDEGIEGAFRIINKIINLKEKIDKTRLSEIDENKINSTIKKVTENIEIFEYPKAVISIVELINYLGDKEKITKEVYEIILKIISPFCPHIAEELWHKLGNKSFISLESWPKADEKKINPALEQQEKAIEKTLEDIRNIMRILKERENKEAKKITIFPIPNELALYKEAKNKIEKIFNLPADVLPIQDSLKLNKKVKAQPGKPGIYLE
jgi:leucyl-tRNA synthetase